MRKMAGALALLLASLLAPAAFADDGGRASTDARDAGEPSVAAPAPLPSSPPPAPRELQKDPSLEVPLEAPTGEEPSPSSLDGGGAEPSTSPSETGSDPSAARAASDATVRLFQAEVFTFLVGRGRQAPEERARKTTVALQRAVQEKGALEVRVGQEGEIAIVYLDERPVLEIGPDDAAAAHEVSAQVLAAKAAAKVREVVRAERSRSRALMTLLSLAFVIFLGLVALFLMQQVGRLTDRARAWILANPERLPALRFRTIDVVTPESLRSGLSVGLSAGKALAQLGVAYGWLLLTLSLFDATRGYAERLTGFVFSPLYTLVGRLVGSLPLLVVAAVAVIGLVVLLRFVGLFFESVQRGETRLEWLPADLAAPTSVLVRAGVVVVFSVLAAPLVGGGDAGALHRASTVALVTAGVAVAPLLASIAVGVTFIYGRRLRVGHFAELGPRAGRVSAVTLLEVRLVDDEGKEVRVPHLLALVQAARVIGPTRPVSVELTLAPAAAGDDEIGGLLASAASAIGADARVELVRFDADGATYRVSASSSASDAQARLAAKLASVVRESGVALGRARPSET